jgi:hypothetical protein
MLGTSTSTKRVYSARKTAVMMEKARQTVIARQQAEVDDRIHRASDPFELAKLALQRAGVPVFSHSLLHPGSTLIVVGNRTMPPEGVIPYAERHGRW